jgi:hypothetical protein
MNGTVGLAAPASGWVGYDYGHARQSMTSTGTSFPPHTLLSRGGPITVEGRPAGGAASHLARYAR